MRQTAKALKERSLESFKATLKEFNERAFLLIWLSHMFSWRDRVPVASQAGRAQADQCRIATGSFDPLSPFGLIRHPTRAESYPCDRAIFGCGAQLDRSGGRAELDGSGRQVSISVFLLPDDHSDPAYLAVRLQRSVHVTAIRSRTDKQGHSSHHRLSQMILDQVFHGVLNEKDGTLEIYDEPAEDPMYPTALETLKTMQDVVKGLYEKATQVA